MKSLPFYELLSKNILAKFFLLTNLMVFAVVFNWSEFFTYVSKISESGCKPISKKLSFAVYDMSGFSQFDYILGGLSVIFSVFYFPSYLATQAIISTMKSDYPQWCAETFDIIFYPIFFVVNSMYLILLSQLIERIHDNYIKDKSAPDNSLSIYSK